MNGYIEKAKSLGFILTSKGDCPDKYTLLYKEKLVADRILTSWYADDDDFNYYDRAVVYVQDDKVFVTGRRVEVGADRPGTSYCENKTVEIGKMDGEKFIVDERYKC